MRFVMCQDQSGQVGAGRWIGDKIHTLRGVASLDRKSVV